ncbi:hypothetical protein KR222_005820, partial [Zaprionus bogoriensis]
STSQSIERLYNQVLKTSMEKAREVQQHLNDTKDAIDAQYFTELKSYEGTQEYYGVAYFVFAVLHSSLDSNQPDQLLQQLLPGEKAAIRDAFSKIREILRKYFAATGQVHDQLMQNLTSWQTETGNGLLETYLHFPDNLQNEVPEIKLTNYAEQSNALVERFARIFLGA